MSTASKLIVASPSVRLILFLLTFLLSAPLTIAFPQGSIEPPGDHERFDANKARVLTNTGIIDTYEISLPLLAIGKTPLEERRDIMAGARAISGRPGIGCFFLSSGSPISISQTFYTPKTAEPLWNRQDGDSLNTDFEGAEQLITFKLPNPKSQRRLRVGIYVEYSIGSTRIEDVLYTELVGSGFSRALVDFRKRVALHNAAIVYTPQAKSVKCAVMNRDERVARFPLLTNCFAGCAASCCIGYCMSGELTKTSREGRVE